MRKQRRLVIAKIYSVLMVCCLIALTFVKCNHSATGENYQLLSFLKTSFYSPSWQKYGVPVVYKAELIYTILLCSLGLVFLFVRDEKFYRILSGGVYTISSMFYAFVFGSCVDLFGVNSLYSYSVFAILLSFIGILISSTVVIFDDKIDKNNKIVGAKC